MSAKISTREPADRPLNVALSHAEVVALINYHVAQSRRIMKTVGKLLLEKRSIFGSNREAINLIREAKLQCDAHIVRVTGLQYILKS